jgi:hypothetical protein
VFRSRACRNRSYLSKNPIAPIGSSSAPIVADQSRGSCVDRLIDAMNRK